MKLTNIDQVHEFLNIVDACEGDVYLTSPYGDRYNLKSKLSQYVAIGAMLGKHGDELELWCSNKDDEWQLIRYISKLQVA